MAREPTFHGSGRDLAIDLVNTVVVIRPAETVDLLESPAQLSAWLESERDRVGPPGDDTPLRLPEFRALREAVRDVFFAAARDDPLPTDAVRKLNEASAAVPSFLRLDVSDPRSPAVATEEAAASRTSAILAHVARSAIGILGGPDRTRLGICAAPRCGRFFLAARPKQVWCTSACGNRARVARHYARTRA